MHSTLFLILRRMRAPLILLILSYAVSILAMTLIPGVDANGRPAPPLDFFHAFYFVSYTATTIGFGEIPMAFSDAQRAWTIVTIYLTVIVWLYSIGTIFGLLQDPAMQRAIRANRFAAEVRRLRQPFYLIAGCGETGVLLLHALDSRNQQAVVLDIDPERVGELELGQYQQDVPALTADARLPENLIAAGLHHPLCAGVIALTNDDPVNLSVAVTTKLLRPELPILCRADLLETAANMASFGVEDVVNAFETFGEHLGIAINNPGHHLLYQWLTGVPGEPLAMPMEPPRGTWLVCGYGRFGKAVARHLDKQGIQLVVVDEHPPAGHKRTVVGRGTEAHTLLEAGIEQAVGIVAGTHDDINNLSIAMTARQLKPGLFVVLRQNRHANAALFQRFAAQATMQPSSIVAHEFLSLLTTPLLPRFFNLALQEGDAWADVTLSRIAAVVGDTVPEVWDRELSKTETLAIWQALSEGQTLRLGDLLRSPSNREENLACIPLLLKRGGEEILVPDSDTPLLDGDRILFCGEAHTRRQQALGLHDYNTLNYLLTGNQAPGGLVWRRLAGAGKP
ncbi:MAG: NAD-binding protein [Thiobacillus sp.]|nr:NAD-binding protein [Thiobacillus sp.]MDP3125463.1 NAD-binding protein [Thiobacillus sp.]